MFIERAAAKGFLLAPAERNMSSFLDHYVVMGGYTGNKIEQTVTILSLR